jgi:hypothetical protein
MIKKFLTVLAIMSFLVLPVFALGQAVPRAQTGELYTAPETSPFIIVERVVNVLFTVLLVAALIVIVIAAFTFVTAAGEPEKVQTARNLIIYAIIGIVVAVAARGVIGYIRWRIGGF